MRLNPSIQDLKRLTGRQEVGKVFKVSSRCRNPDLQMSLTSKTTAFASRPVLAAGANRTAYLLLFLYILTKPFYFFDSGLPQIADIFASLLFVVIILSKGNIHKEHTGIYTACLVFCAYTLLVSIAYFLLLGDVRTAMAGVFYTYNAIILYTILKMGSSGEKFTKILMVVIVASSVIQALFSIAVETNLARETLFFNNPNQFSYWVLLSATIYCICAKQIGVRVITQLFIWVIFCYLLLLGLSKAAMISAVLLAIIHFSRKTKHVLIFMIFAGLIFAAAQGTQIIGNATDRLTSIGEQEDDDIGGRGYNRILKYPEYLLFGAGEYALERFPGAKHEIHSTVGTIVFSYGLIGTSIFGAFIWLLYRRVGFVDMLYLVPAFLYGGVHQGLRFTFLWILFGLLAVTAEMKRREREPEPVTGSKAVECVR